MSRNRTRFLGACAVLALACASPATLPQQQAPQFKVGDKVQERFAGGWIPCTVTGLDPGGYKMDCDFGQGHSVMSVNAPYSEVRAAQGAAAAAAPVPEAQANAAALQGLSGPGARFGARNPVMCTDRKAPARGAPSSEQAAHAFQCDYEHVDAQYLVLMSGVKAEVGRARDFNIVTDSFPDIDPSQKVYPLRGSYTSYRCVALGDVGGYAGRNCTRMDEPHATGLCYKDGFGDWHCRMVDSSASPTGIQYPPPRN